MSLEIADLSFGYGKRTIGANVSVSIHQGEVLALLGPNGTGKTTFFKTVLRLLPPIAGHVLLDGTSVDAISGLEMARSIAYGPQAHTAMFPFTVEDVVLMGRASRIPPFAVPGDRDRSVAIQVLDGIGIGHLRHRVYTEISGGERQMVLIARALAQEPKLLIMDEPTASLDYGNQMRVLGHIRRLANDGMTVILSTHNPDHVFMIADRVAVLHEGRLAALGSPREVLTEELIKSLYDIDVSIGTVPGSGTLVCSPRLNREGGS